MRSPPLWLVDSLLEDHRSPGWESLLCGHQGRDRKCSKENIMVCSLKLCKCLSNHRGCGKDIGCIPESSDETGWFGVKAVTHTSGGRGTHEKENGGVGRLQIQLCCATLGNSLLSSRPLFPLLSPFRSHVVWFDGHLGVHS